MFEAWIPPSEVERSFLLVVGAVAIVLLLWDTLEVGRNDAANMVNAIFGARILTQRTAVWLAGCGVILGASAAIPVVETARKGIFSPEMLTLEAALAVFVSVYIVDTVLLYAYSAFGLPVSTTACLVFELMGAALAVGGVAIVNWDKAGAVLLAIFLSILISAAAGFVMQRVARGVLRDRGQDLAKLKRHGGWMVGGMLAGLCYFMLVRGMEHIGPIEAFRSQWLNPHGWAGDLGFIIVTWGIIGVVTHILLFWLRDRAAHWLLPFVALTGTVCMGFAFGQNDLANCISPGLAALHLLGRADQAVGPASAVPIHPLVLTFCGVLLVVGMATRNAHRVTRAEVNTGSMSNTVGLYAPRWCIILGRMLLRFRGKAESLAPAPSRSAEGKKLHYDPLRACVILTVSASVIASASSLSLPVSTTYVAFAAVVATGAADRIFQRGDADLKMARTIWVVFNWFAAAVIAAVAAGLVCLAVYHFHVWGIVVGLVINLVVRSYVKAAGDRQEQRIALQARERFYPEEFSEVDESS